MLESEKPFSLALETMLYIPSSSVLNIGITFSMVSFSLCKPSLKPTTSPLRISPVMTSTNSLKVRLPISSTVKSLDSLS